MRSLTEYIADYVNTELDRGNIITDAIIEQAIEAFEGGAHDGVEYKVTVRGVDK